MRNWLLVFGVVAVAGAALAANAFSRSTGHADEGMAQRGSVLTTRPSDLVVIPPTADIGAKTVSSCQPASLVPAQQSGAQQGTDTVIDWDRCCIPCDDFEVCGCAVRC